MKWGLVCRAETNRGLGIQTLAMYQNLDPDATLIVDVPQSGFVSHIENYGKEAHIITLDDGLPETLVRDWWSGLDVVVSVETLYDERLQSWAEADGVRTIIHGNPEFVKPTQAQPSEWWWPTTWRLDKLPHGRVIPVPVPDDTTLRCGSLTDAPHFLHIAGNRAMGDRNGSLIVKNSLRALDSCARFTSYCQKDGFDYRRENRNAVELPPVDDRWTMYDGKHVLVLPRRFGGLCLPALEAMASGLVVMMPDCSPNMDWPILTVTSQPSKVLQMPAGDVQTHDVLSTDLRSAMNAVASNLAGLVSQRERVAEWVEHNRWSVLAPVYHEAIDAAQSRR